MLELRDLVMGYAGRTVVPGMNLRLEPGRICGLLGPNGAGKSTIVKAIVGLLRPISGTVRIGGCDMAERPLDAKRQLGYLPELPVVYEALSVEEHLALVGALHGLAPEDIASRGGQLLEVFRIDDARRTRLSALSKGMRQKVLIAAALLHDPQLIVLDEPLSGLDANAVRTLRDLLRRLAGQGRTILYVSHLLDVVERVCDRVVILDHGAVVADGPTAELRSRAGDGTIDGLFRQLTAGPDEEGAVAAMLDRLVEGSAATPAQK